MQKPSLLGLTSCLPCCCEILMGWSPSVFLPQADPIHNYYSNSKGNSLGMRGVGGGHVCSHFHKCWNNSNSSCRLPGWGCRADRISMGSTPNSRFVGFSPRASRDNCSLCDSTVLSPLVVPPVLVTTLLFTCSNYC